MAERPLSPHLSIWRWSPAMLVSILHRVTGDGMAFVALPVLLWWLAALAGGPDSYATFTSWMWADFAMLEWSGLGDVFISLLKILLKVVTIGISWAFFNHLCSGIRHFFLDIGAGYEIEKNKRWAMATTVTGVVLTAAFWAAIVLV